MIEFLVTFIGLFVVIAVSQSIVFVAVAPLVITQVDGEGCGCTVLAILWMLTVPAAFLSVMFLWSTP